ncbi:hypothetical protein HDF16_006243 [Granulicella aggregans]|uniref:Uncharacterized protein n=1 Tax=Granulicella aggregans TaxID=474949 RepID=A0A7W7ZKF3_9BACT|nr:hypothetical protein [Granulicella aggregans]
MGLDRCPNGFAAEVLQVAMDHVVVRDGLHVVFVSGRQQLDGICKLLLPGDAVLHVLGDLLECMARLHGVDESATKLRAAG